MRYIALSLLAFMAAGCQEATVHAGAWITNPPNPPDLAVPEQVDRTVQIPTPSVDVLWVIDNSCSMAEEQTALTTNFTKFINYFVGSGLDYHIGVVSTGWDDPSERGRLLEGRGTRWIDSDNDNPAATFREMGLIGTDGPSAEKGRAQVYGAIELLGDTVNEGFYRDDASLAVIVISDEDDASGHSPISLPNFMTWLRELKTEDGRISFSSIVGPDGGCSNADEGRDYLKVTRGIGGIEFPICNGEWGGVLDDLGVQAAGLKREFYLSSVPVEDSITVWVETKDGEETFSPGTDYTYSRSRNSVRFKSYIPQPLSEIFVSYIPLSENQTPDED
ncbi:MAG: hypothetical protein ACI9MC_001494 [Kiritimatiellia bacterium]|jgi:hypothetical protein